MVAIYIDQRKITMEEDTLFDYLETHNFNEAWVPCDLWRDVYLIMKKKGFVLEIVVEEGGKKYDVWKLDI